MKIVNNPKSIKVNHLLRATNYSIFFIAALTLTLGITTFTACSNDRDTPEVISVKDIEGNYTGKANIAFTESSTSSTPILQIEVEVRVKEDTIYFGKFPIDVLITSIVGEEKAPEIIQLAGDISYKVGYKPTFNEGYTQILQTLDPKPLKFTIENPSEEEGEQPDVIEIEATVSAPDKGVFTYQDKTLKFKLIIERAKLNGESCEGFPMEDLTFEMNKK